MSDDLAPRLNQSISHNVRNREKALKQLCVLVANSSCHHYVFLLFYHIENEMYDFTSNMVKTATFMGELSESSPKT